MTRRRPRRGRSAWVGVGIGLLAVVAVFLVVVAFQLNRVRGEPSHDAAPPPAVGTAIPSPEGTAPDSPGPSATPSAPELSRTEDAQILRMFDSGYGYRAVRAACGAPGAMIERTTDGGVTWTRMDLGSPGVQVVVAIRIVDADQTDAVVRKAGDCGTSVSTSFTGGEFWADFPERLAEQVYPDPVASKNIRVGAQTIVAPCSGVVDVWSDPAGLVALCPGQVIRYSNATGEWSTVATGDILAASADGSTGSGLVMLAGDSGDSGCEGMLVAAFDESSTIESRACLDDDLVGDRATLAITGTQAWVWSGTGILKSEDGGLTWAQVG